MIERINAIIIGHVLTYLAIFLNYVDGDQYTHDGKLGIALGIIGLAGSYFLEAFSVMGKCNQCLLSVFYWTSVIGVTASYIVWLTY